MYGNFRVFTWRWNGAQWVNLPEWSTAVYQTHQQAETQAAEIKTHFPVFAEPGWYYVGLYYRDRNAWVYEEGERFYVQPRGAYSWRTEAEPPSVPAPSDSSNFWPVVFGLGLIFGVGFVVVKVANAID